MSPLQSQSAYLWLPVLVGLQSFHSAGSVDTAYNLCEPPRHGFDLKGDDFPSVGDTSRLYVNLTGRKPHDENPGCWMRFTTCNKCRFRVEPISKFTYQTCLWNINNFDNKCAPGCTYVHLFDQDYRNETSRSFTSSSWAPKNMYYTFSKTLFVYVCSNQSQIKDVQFSLNLTVVAKRQNIRGSVYDTGLGRTNFVTSPAFPNFYAENHDIFEYHFQAVNYDEFVELHFDDWNLSPRSVLAFYENEDSNPLEVYGSSHRPVVVSNSHKLTLRFQTGGQASSSLRNFMGFKVSYFFKNNRRQIKNPITDCGGYDMNRVGGLVTFDPKMSTNEYYDCIWVLKRHPEFSMIYAKLIEFQSSSIHEDTVEIRGGLTSLGSTKALVTYDNVDDYKLDSFENDTGFYIRLKGRYNKAKDFVLAFASYKYGGCRYHEFKCFNSRCISVSLTCDGYDHCGDNSDERQSMCGTDTTDYSGYSYTISIGVIIPMAISIFLIVVICLLIIFIRRCRTLSQQNPRNGRQAVSSVSSNMARRNRRGRNRSRIRMNLTIQQDAPPTYDEVIQNTPIGYLNMAFMWSQPDVNTGMINPPTYEEATSPTTDLPRLTSPQNVLNQSAESTSSVDSLESHPCTLPPASDTSSDDSVMGEHQRRPDSQSSFSSDSTSSDRNHYTNHENTNSQPPATEHGHQENQPQQRQRKIHQDDFIECPVSSSTLQNKEQTTPSEGQSARGKEVGAVACPDQSGDQSSSQSQSSEDQTPTHRGRGREIKKKTSPSRSRTDPAVTESDSCHGQNKSPVHDQAPQQDRSNIDTPVMARSHERGREVVLRSPSQSEMHRLASPRYGSVLETNLDTPDSRVRGNYLSLSLDTGEEDPDIFV